MVDADMIDMFSVELSKSKLYGLKNHMYGKIIKNSIMPKYDQKTRYSCFYQVPKKYWATFGTAQLIVTERVYKDLMNVLLRKNDDLMYLAKTSFEITRDMFDKYTKTFTGRKKTVSEVVKGEETAKTLQQWAEKTHYNLEVSKTSQEKKVLRVWRAIDRHKNRPIFTEKPMYLEGKVYFPDIYIKGLRIVIEVDGGYHNTKEQREKDRLRDEIFLRNGIKIYRIKNDECDNTAELRKIVKSIYDEAVENKRRRKDEYNREHKMGKYA